MRIRMRYFAQAADAAGCRDEEIELAGHGQDELREALVRRHPGLAPLLDVCRLAVNGAYVPYDHALADGDEVALIPPVSGG